MAQFIEVNAYAMKEKWLINIDSISFIVPEHQCTYGTTPTCIHFIADKEPLQVEETYKQLKEKLC